MEKKRNFYMISVSMKSYLVAAIAAMLIQNVNTIIDGVLMGHFLGTEAFSAINLCLPMVGMMATLGMMMYGGATTLSSLAIGAREEKKANDYFTVSLVSVAVLSVVLGVLLFIGINGVTNIICQESALKEYVKNYLLVYIIGCPITLISSALLSYAGIGGKPKLVTIASASSIIVNLVGDVVFVSVFHMGIRGAALATVAGSAISMIVIVADSKRNGSILRLQKVEGAFLSNLKEILIYGLPVTMQAMAVVVYSYVCTFCAQKFGGVNGAFAGSLLTQITTICQGVSGGVMNSYNAIGGLLSGQKDYKGVNFLFKKGLVISVIFATVCAGIMMFIIPEFAGMMGATTPEMVEYSTRSIRMAIPFVIPITIIWIMPGIYAIAGKLSIPPVISVLQPVTVGIGLYMCGTFIGDDAVWLGYPVSAVIILLILVVLTEYVRKKSGEDRHFFSLLLNDPGGRNVYDISVECNQEALIETLRDTNEFFDRHNIDEKIGMRVRLCIEELMANIIDYAKKSNKQQFFDLKIVVNQDSISAIIKDDGRQFNPITAEEKGCGLKIINGLCPKLEYNYSYGQNMVFMTWDKDTK